MISRLELGEQLPDRNAIKQLDDALSARGRVEHGWLAAVGEQAGAEGAPATLWVHNYPAAYHGLSWMHVRAPGSADANHVTLEVRWGPWSSPAPSLAAEPRGLVVAHQGRRRLVDSGDRANERAGDGQLPHRPRTDGALDINPGWEHDGR